MPHRDVVVIGTSAGGLEALQAVFRSLPHDFDAAILVVMHRTENAASILPDILARHSHLPIVSPTDGQVIRRRHIYLAPAGVHMLVDHSRIRLVRGPRENRHRPAIDPLFRSAAVTFGPRVIGVVLTGMLDDGTSGLMVVCAHGGAALVQDPESAMFPPMPQNALRRVPDAEIVPLEQVPEKLASMITQSVDAKGYAGFHEDLAARETRVSELVMSELEKLEKPGTASEFACPECGGVLWEIEQGDLLRFRCRVGHAYTADHLQAAQRHAVETALWAALRALEESLSMYTRLASRAKASQNVFAAEMYNERVESTASNARILREFLLTINGHGEEAAPDIEESA